MTKLSHEDVFAVMSRASIGFDDERVALPADADLDDPVTALGAALNVLLDDLQYRRDQAEHNLRLLLEERIQRERDAREAVRRREEFISIAAHEIYTPLTSLKLVLQALRQGVVPNEPERLQHVLALAERQTHKLAHLVDALLSVGRSQSNAPMKLRLEQHDLVALARSVAELFAPDLQRSASKLTIHAEGPVLGTWDRDRIEQVITNLLGNAIKFGGGKPIDIAISQHDGTARLAVSDRGIGISPERMPRIFERFERGVSSSHYGGLGLGLSIVREIVRGHGGTVRADSVLGAGTTFVVELPCAGPPSEDGR